MKHNNNHEAALCRLMYISNAYLYLNASIYNACIVFLSGATITILHFVEFRANPPV